MRYAPPVYQSMEFFILYLACSPMLEQCFEFKDQRTFKTLNICKEEAMKSLDKIKLEFEKKDLPAKIYVTCKEINNGISS